MDEEKEKALEDLEDMIARADKLEKEYRKLKARAIKAGVDLNNQERLLGLMRFFGQN